MALFIRFTAPQWTPIQWHTGEPLPPFDVHHVAMVQADGDELQHIIWNFKNLPVVTGRNVVAWEGEMARFIVMNLR